MRIPQFFAHHGIGCNPFAEEDAQTDHVFKEHCITSTFHPTWDKVYGSPIEPATAVVFGEKGSGKTAMCLQIARHLELHNQRHPAQRNYVVCYDDLNPFLDRFRERLPRRKRRPDRVLAQWRLWDHMDAILALAVTGLVDRLLQVRQPSRKVNAALDPQQVDQLDRYQARDLLLLAACYDQSTAETFTERWRRLRRRLRFSSWLARWDLALGLAGTLGLLVLLYSLLWHDQLPAGGGVWWLLVLALLLAWAPRLWHVARTWWLARSILRHVRVGNQTTLPLWQSLMRFRHSELASQPLPLKDRTDDRYELLLKLQGVLQTLGYTGITVLFDRLDEPHLINGSADLMKAVLWPMLDNKFLKHPGLGLKLMLPMELRRYLDHEDRAFQQRARLDKQNVVASFEWSGESLFDVANARVQACAEANTTVSLRQLFDESVSQQRLIEAFRHLRVPRHLFKFMHRLCVAHCNLHTDEQPVWGINATTFESTLAVYLRDQEQEDRR